MNGPFSVIPIVFLIKCLFRTVSLIDAFGGTSPSGFHVFPFYYEKYHSLSAEENKQMRVQVESRQQNMVLLKEV